MKSTDSGKQSIQGSGRAVSAVLAWRILAVLQIPLVAGWLLYLAQPDKLGSRALLLFTAAACLFSLLIVGGAWFYPKLARLPPRMRQVLVLGLAGAAFAVGFVARPEWIYVLTALNVAATGILAALTLLPDGADRPLPRWAWIALAAGAFAVIFLRIYGLSYYPFLETTDEPWGLSWTLGYLRTGRLDSGLMFYGNDNVNLYFLPVAWWMGIVGAGLWQARIFSYLVTLAVVVFGGMAGATLYNRATGWITAFVLFASAIVMVGARVRSDAGLALAVALTLWLFGLAARRKHWWLHGLAGLMIGLGLFGHYHAVGFGPVLLIALYGPRYAGQVRAGDTWKRWLPEPGFWAFAAGGLLGAGIAVAVQILPDLDAFIRMRAPRTPGNWSTLLNAVWGYVTNIAFLSRYEWVLILLGLGAALWRRARIDVSIVLAVLLAHAGLALMAPTPWIHYIMPLSPLYALLIASLLTQGIGRVRDTQPLSRRLAVIGLCATLPALGMTLYLPAAKLAYGAPVQLPEPPAVRWVREHIAQDALIEGELYYYPWLNDYRYVSPLAPLAIPPERRAELNTLEAQWADISPDVIILDPNFNTCCLLGPLAESGWLEENGYVKATEIPGEHAPITIYVRDRLLTSADG